LKSLIENAAIKNYVSISLSHDEKRNSVRALHAAAFKLLRFFLFFFSFYLFAFHVDALEEDFN
jgi:hypothetical protein